MLTVRAFDNFQKAVPETEVIGIHTAYTGFSGLVVEMPGEVQEYFRHLLGGAREHLDGKSCSITLMPSGRLQVELTVPDRVFGISPEVPEKYL